MASAFPSKGVVNPAARLAVRGLDVVALGPSSEVCGRVAVSVNSKAATVASVGSLGQPHGVLHRAASHAGGSRREPAVAEDQFTSSPFDLVAKLATKLCPGGVAITRATCRFLTRLETARSSRASLPWVLARWLDTSWRKFSRIRVILACSRERRWMAVARFRERGLVRDRARERRRSRPSRTVSGLGALKRPTSTPSEVAATAKVASPRSTPTNATRWSEEPSWWRRHAWKSGA